MALSRASAALETAAMEQRIQEWTELASAVQKQFDRLADLIKHIDWPNRIRTNGAAQPVQAG